MQRYKHARPWTRRAHGLRWHFYSLAHTTWPIVYFVSLVVFMGLINTVLCRDMQISALPHSSTTSMHQLRARAALTERGTAVCWAWDTSLEKWISRNKRQRRYFDKYSICFNDNRDASIKIKELLHCLKKKRRETPFANITVRKN